MHWLSQAFIVLLMRFSNRSERPILFFRSACVENVNPFGAVEQLESVEEYLCPAVFRDDVRSQSSTPCTKSVACSSLVTKIPSLPVWPATEV